MTDELARVVSSSLGGSARADAVAALLRAHGVSLAQLEASVRAGRGGRMMIERAPRELIEPLATELGVALSAELLALRDAAFSANVPLIAGWDAEGDRVLAKLYANASDASREVRSRIADAVGWSARLPAGDAPHLLAVNASSARAERKAYVQYPVGAGRVAGSLGEGPRGIAAMAGSHSVDAGSVVSFDVTESGALPRAYFVALRDGEDGGPAERFLAALPGWDATEVERALPFARGHCRSVGVPVGDSLTPWTAYFKPRRGAVPLWSLEPAGVFRAGPVEVSVFVAPAEYAPRAYARTARHAISYRVREGAPERATLEALMRWAADQVRRAESTGSAIALVGTAPSPWRRV